MDNAGLPYIVGALAASLIANAGIFYALTLTLRAHRAELERITGLVAGIIARRQLLEDKVHVLETQMNGSDWLIERLKQGCVPAHGITDPNNLRPGVGE